LAARDPHAESVRKALARNADMRVAEPLAAVHAADIVFLATPFAANGEALAPVTGALKGRCWSIAPTPSARA
jgi:predicted dinucleotide-binding enzyme